MAFGLNTEGSPSTGKANSMDGKRNSIDSGYYSMIAKPKRGSQGGLSQTTIFTNPGTETSPDRSPRTLHKAISTTFSGAMQAFSNTVRSSTSYIYPIAGEPELPSSEWAECETPKKQSRRSSIMSSVRSRKLRFSPRARDKNNESPERKSSVPVAQEKAPALQVEIPNPSLSYGSLGRPSISAGSHLLAAVKLPAAGMNLWPGPTRITTEQALGNDRRGTLHPESLSFDDPYVEQGDVLQHGLPLVTSASGFALESLSPETNRRYPTDDKGYFSEVESNADVSESDGMAPACLKYVAPGSPEARNSSPCRHRDHAASHIHAVSSTSPCQRKILSRMSSSVPSGSKPSMPKTLDGTAEPTAPPHSPSRNSSYHCASPEDALNASLPSDEDAMTSQYRPVYKGLPSDVYDADAESLESSMGSRAAWERHRADRERRYMEAIDMAPNTESDEEAGPELELKRSPSKKPVHYAEELVHGTVNIGGPECTPRYPTGDLRYAVEAIERPAMPVGHLAYAVEAIERPSVTTFDPLETVFQQRPMLRLSDKIEEQKTSQGSDAQDLSPSCMEFPSLPPADLSPSRVELPSSPESCPVDLPADPEFTMMTMKITNEDLMTFGASHFDSRSISRFSCDSTDSSANSSPAQQSHAAAEDSYEAVLKAGNLLVSTYSPVGEDAYEAGLRAAGIFMPTCPPDVAQARPAMDTSHGTYREQLGAGFKFPNLRSRNGTPFDHSRTVSALSDVTDDSCAITTHSPSCNAPPPFPSLHVRSEPARRIPSAIDALTAYGDEQIRIAGPANAGLQPSLPSPFDGPGDETDEVGSQLSSPKTLESATSPGQYNLRNPSPGTTSSILFPRNSNTPQETFNAATLPNIVSPSLLPSRKARRKQKKSSSGMRTVPFADITMKPRNMILEPDSSLSKRELNKNSDWSKTQMSLDDSARITGGSVQKPSPSCQSGRKNRRSRNQTSLEEFTGMVGGSVKRLDPSSTLNSGNKESRGKGQAAATSLVTSNPPQIKTPRGRGKASYDDTLENAESAVKDSESRLEPEFCMEVFEQTAPNLSSYANRNVGSTVYAGHELDSVFQENVSVYSCPKLDEDLQQDSDKEAAHFTSGHETIGNDSESDKNASRAPVQKKEKKGEPPPVAKEKFTLQKQLERKSDRACSRLLSNLNDEALRDDHIGLDDSAHKEGRPPWRP